jgi:hypothetical protein
MRTQSRNQSEVKVIAKTARSAADRNGASASQSTMQRQPPTHILSSETRHIGSSNRAGASVFVALVFSLVTLSLVFAASVSADGSVEAEKAPHQHVTTDAESPPNQEPPPPDLSASPTRDELSVLWPWRREFEPGHDKCKRWRGYPLPLWCFGLSSWPVLKARAVTATVPGIRDGGLYPPTRRKHA